MPNSSQSDESQSRDRNDPLTTTYRYRTLRPAETEVSPQSLAMGFEQLHDLAREHSSSGLFSFGETQTMPVIEQLLVSQPGEAGAIECYFGVPHDPTTPPDEGAAPETLTQLEQILQDAFPNAYDI